MTAIKAYRYPAGRLDTNKYVTSPLQKGGRTSSGRPTYNNVIEHYLLPLWADHRQRYRAAVPLAVVRASSRCSPPAGICQVRVL
jgi:hypothetical protein